jgi:serine/threonine protein phosphatase PrpC
LPMRLQFVSAPATKLDDLKCIYVVQANDFVYNEFLATLNPHMPLTLPSSFRTSQGAGYAVAVRAAISQTLETLNTKFCERQEIAGCTCTVVVVTGELLTVANLGDSDAVLDVFSEVVPMTTPHRVNDNVEERTRVECAGAFIAPLSVRMDGPAKEGEPGLGPLRIWPGGLCVSRGIGDVDVGESVIARPHIRQVVVPDWGCRLVVSSDGVWDCISRRTVISTCRVCALLNQLLPS